MVNINVVGCIDICMRKFRNDGSHPYFFKNGAMHGDFFLDRNTILSASTDKIVEPKPGENIKATIILRDGYILEYTFLYQSRAHDLFEFLVQEDIREMLAMPEGDD